ncbi:hypothetical protein [Pseudomonas orientalis]|uniref:hypothetical protein n=1 Tax=Pseudomonas orientalis TaxID=76758 RepID=UPI00320B8684
MPSNTRLRIVKATEIWRLVPRRDLKEAAALLKWSGVDLMKMAIRLSDAGFENDAMELLTIIGSFPDAEDKLAGYADKVKAGRIVWGSTASAKPIL